MGRRIIGASVQIAVLSLIGAVCAIGSFERLHGDPPGDRWAKTAALAASGIEQRNIPSVSIAVARKGNVVWEQSFGWADRAAGIKASPDTVYSLASTTKPIVATGLLVLARSGTVDLDAPVERYIGPGRLTIFEGSARDVTLRRLLHHTAGLPQHFNYFYADEPDAPPPFEETVRRFGIIVAPPGRDFAYANLGYGLIGDVIARVSGKSLGAFLRDEVFRPLGMRSAVFDPDLPRPGQIAVEYDNKGGVIPFHVCDTPGAGQAYASVRDLIRFGMFHLKDRLKDQARILEDAAIERMQTERDGASNRSGGKEAYGLGWFFADAPGGVRTVWHEGGWTGASVLLKLVPSEDLAVAAAINVFDSEFVNRVADEAIRAVRPGYGTSETRPAGPSGPAAPSFDLEPGVYAGGIRLSDRTIPLILEKTVDGKIQARLGGPSAPAVPVFIPPPVVARAPGQFLGSIPGPIGDPSAARHPHRIFLDLRADGGALTGTASAMTMGGQAFAPTADPRMHFHLPYRVSLKRTV